MGKKVPEKIYFRIGEVSQITGIKPFVLRYWETEFPRLAPLRRGSKQRLYRKEDIELVLQIKRMLYQDKFTIAGAKRKLGSRVKEEQAEETGVSGDSRNEETAALGEVLGQSGMLKKYRNLFREIHRELNEIKKILQSS